MNNSIIQLLNTVKLVDVIVTAGLFFLIAGVLLTQRSKIKACLDHWHEKRTFEETVMKCITDNREDIELVRKKVANLEAAVDVIQEIKMTLDNMQEKERLSKQANIKDKIERIYRESNQSKVCTDMQLETLKGLIQDYERYGGENSFVHSVVVKEMYTWKVIKMIPDKKEA